MAGAPAKAIAAWEVGGNPDLPGTFDDLRHCRELWLDVAAAVSCWPGLPVAVERRIVLDAGEITEFILISALGLGRDDARAAGGELGAVLRPVFEQCGATPCKPLRAMALAGLIDGMTDIAEIRTLSPEAPEGPRSFGTSIIRTLSLATGTMPADSSFVISTLIGTPTAGAPEAESAMPFFVLPKAPHRRPTYRPIGFRMRVAATTALPRPVIATAASVALDADQLAGAGWWRPRTAADKAVALAELRGLASAPWGLGVDEEEELATTATVATVLSLPTVPPAAANVIEETECFEAEQIALREVPAA